MGKYDTTKIRNLGIVAHSGAGKTSLIEAMLYNTGMTPALGKVADGSSNLDYEPEEIKRGVTLASKLHHCDWNGYSLHLCDTPGYSNFLHDTRNCLRVLGGAVVMISAISGVKAQTQQIWKWADEFEIPRLAFVNKMDRERADFLKAVDDMEKALQTRAVLITIPMGAAETYVGTIDLIRQKARTFTGDDKGSYTEGPVPAEYAAEVKRLRTLLMEAVADADDALMEKYLETDSLSEEDILLGLREGTLTRTFTPVLCGSATRNMGVRQLMDYAVACLPSPVDKGTQVGTDPRTGDTIERRPTDDEPFSGMVFKTINDPFAGKLSILRIYSGRLRPDSTLYNPSRQCNEKIGPIFEMEGRKQHPIDEGDAGDLVAIPKLKETVTGDTLCDPKAPILYESPIPAKAVISFAIAAAKKGEEDKIGQGLHRLMEEDPALQFRRDDETHEMLLSGVGQVHLEVAAERLKRKYGAEIILKEPKVPYRETIRGSTKVQGKYKKQTGGRGQFGDVWIELAPTTRGAGFEFVNAIVGGVVPRQYVPAVEKGIEEAMHKGILGGFPVVDVKATLFDGSHHSVDSSEMAFKIAGSMAFKKACELCRPTLLEPIMMMEITVPDDCMGDIIGDMNSRRGKVLGVEPQAGSQAIKVQVPMAEVLRYAPELRSMTSDRGMFTMEFSHYEEVPTHQASKILEEMKQQQA